MERKKCILKVAVLLALSISMIGLCVGCKGKKSSDDGASKSYAEINKEETGLKVYYDMTLNEAGDALADKSGNGNDGTILIPAKVTLENNEMLLDGGYIRLPEGLFEGEDTVAVSLWVKSYTGGKNTSAMYIGTYEKNPVAYWLLNPNNTEGKLKSVITNSKNESAPYNTEVGVSPTKSSLGVAGPLVGTEWNHYVVIIEEGSMSTYMNNKLIAKTETKMKVSDFGDDLVAYLGRSSYPDDSFTGFIKEVKIYDKTLTEKEISDLYDEGNTVKAGTEAEILIADRADPYIVLGDDGYYYFTASYPMYGGADPQGYDRIILRRSTTIEGLSTAEEKVIWDENTSATASRYIWAPEMHNINGVWYMLYTASVENTNVWAIRCHVLMCTGDDPYNDEWVEKGPFQPVAGDDFSFSGFSLDMTYFENNGRHYVIWAQSGGNSNLYMAEIDPNEPWKCISENMLLTRPTYYWENVNIPVNEGAAVLKHDGKIFVTFSAAATGPEYCIGLIYADEDADLLDRKSWTKLKTPLLESEDLIDEYGPGHNSFTVDEEGNTIFVYHSRPKECYEGNCGYSREDPLYDPCRSARIRTVTWDEDGMPVLNN